MVAVTATMLEGTVDLSGVQAELQTLPDATVLPKSTSEGAGLVRRATGLVYRRSHATGICRQPLHAVPGPCRRGVQRSGGCPTDVRNTTDEVRAETPSPTERLVHRRRGRAWMF